MEPERKLVGLAVFVGVCFLAAAFAYLVNGDAIEVWYPTLAKPSWTAPAWIFGPVWTALYLLMAVAGWLVWWRVGWSRGGWALGLFGLQLLFNAAWSPVFFGLQSPGGAFAVIVVLWVLVLLTTWAFFRLLRPSALMMVPYLLWATYAAALNLAIWRLNA